MWAPRCMKTLAHVVNAFAYFVCVFVRLCVCPIILGALARLRVSLIIRAIERQQFELYMNVVHEHFGQNIYSAYLACRCVRLGVAAVLRSHIVVHSCVSVFIDGCVRAPCYRSRVHVSCSPVSGIKQSVDDCI